MQFGFLLFLLRKQITQQAVLRCLPATYEQRRQMLADGLMSCGSDLRDSFQQGAIYIARILKGARPGDLPVVRGTRFELILNLKAAKAPGLAVPDSLLARVFINLKTAKALGLTIPPPLLSQANEVIG